MESTVENIPLINLAIAFIPVCVVLVLLYQWSLQAKTAFYSIVRMLLQLIIIGYVLVFIFESENLWVTLFILTIMVTASSWIALRTIENLRLHLFKYVFISSLIGGGSVLLLTVWLVLETGQVLAGISPLIAVRYQILVMCMIFSSCALSTALLLIITKKDFIKSNYSSDFDN